MDRPSQSWTLGLVWSSLLIVAAMVLGFMLFGEIGVDQLRRSPPQMVVAVGVLLLCVDIFIPVPSTVVVVILAQSLGPVPAVLAGTAGISLGCSLGFYCGMVGRSRALRLVDAASSPQMNQWLSGTRALLVLAALRAIPIIGESSVVVAGLVGLRARDVLLVTSLANLALVISYVVLSGWADDLGGLAAGILVAWLLPAVAIGLFYLFRPDKTPDTPR